jgi:glycosyltransferase involved in cell wall biosynthesis
LGIFSGGNKAQDTLTNKICQILASQKPLITMRSKATDEFSFINEKNCLLVEPDNPEDLANAIIKMMKSDLMRKAIASEGFQLFNKELSMKATGLKLEKYIKNLIINFNKS